MTDIQAVNRQLVKANTDNAELARQQLDHIATLHAKRARGEQITAGDLGDLNAMAQQIHLTARSTATGVPSGTVRTPAPVFNPFTATPPAVAELPSPDDGWISNASSPSSTVMTYSPSQPIAIDASDAGSAGDHE